MSNLISKITEALLKNKSVALIGSSDSGKSYWVEHELVPFLKQYKKVVIFENGEVIQKEQGDIFIFDEAETLFDQHFLEEKHQEESPYYSTGYLERVRRWHKLYAEFSQVSLFVISRNAEDEINYLVENFKKTDWDDREITVFKFDNGDSPHYIEKSPELFPGMDSLL